MMLKQLFETSDDGFGGFLPLRDVALDHAAFMG
jgi:hypothetical protein